MGRRIITATGLAAALAVVAGMCGYFLVAVDAAEQAIIPFASLVGFGVGLIIGVVARQVRQGVALGLGISGLAFVLLPISTKAPFSALLPAPLLEAGTSPRLAQAVEAVIDGPIGYVGGAILLLMGWVLWGLPDKVATQDGQWTQDGQRWSDRDDDPLTS